MARMNAAVVTSFGEPPHYQQFEVPQPNVAELPSLVAEITAGTIAVTATTMPLADVEQIWPRAETPGERTVLVP